MGFGDGPHDVAAGERRRLGRETTGPGQVLIKLGHIAAPENGPVVAAERLLDGSGDPARLSSPDLPLGLQGLAVDVELAFGLAGGEGGELGAPSGGAALLGLGLDDLLPALGMGVDPRPGDALDLRASVVHWGPLDTQAPGELVTQRRLVDEATGPAVVVEQGAVEGAETVIGTLGHVGHEQVRVQLGVAGPAGAMAEGGHDEPFAAHVIDAVVAPPAHGGVVLGVGDGLRRRRLVGGRHLRLHVRPAEGVQKRDRLRGRQGDVEARAGIATLAAPPRQQALAGGGVGGAEDELQGLPVHLSGQAQVLGQPSVPATWGLARADVVVLHAIGDRLQVVVVFPRGQLPDAEHESGLVDAYRT